MKNIYFGWNFWAWIMWLTLNRSILSFAINLIKIHYTTHNRSYLHIISHPVDWFATTWNKNFKRAELQTTTKQIRNTCLRLFNANDMRKFPKPFNTQEDPCVSFHRNFNSILRRDHQKKFLWASRLWIGRRKEPILGYVLKNNEKK